MGEMTVLNQLSHLPSTVGTFYSILPQQTGQASVSFSLPYMDFTGTGQFPLYDNNLLLCFFLSYST